MFVKQATKKNNWIVTNWNPLVIFRMALSNILNKRVRARPEEEEDEVEAYSEGSVSQDHSDKDSEVSSGSQQRDSEIGSDEDYDMV